MPKRKDARAFKDHEWMKKTLGKVQAAGGGGGSMSNGKRKAATFGQDLMRGEHVVGGGA